MNIQDLLAAHGPLTQSGFLSGTPNAIPTDLNAAAVTFSRTYAASVTAEYMFEVGTGKMDPSNHLKMLVEHARHAGIPASTIVSNYLEILRSLAYDYTEMRKLVTKIVGGSDRPILPGRVPAVTPTYVVELVDAYLEPNHPVIFKYMLADFVCNMVAPLGWIAVDAPYIYRVVSRSTFPSYDDLIDQVEVAFLANTLDALANSDLSMLAKAISDKRSVLPSLVAQHICNAAVTAIDMSRATYDSVSVVNSVLTAVLRARVPNVPEALALSPRVQNHPILTDLSGNLSIFIAAQEMYRENPSPYISFDAETMVSQILPFFQASFEKTGVYSIRMLADVVNRYGKISVRDEKNRPAIAMLYEEWTFAKEVEAFSFVRHTPTGDESFLVVHNPISDALREAMNPVQGMFATSKLVESKADTLMALPQDMRFTTTGTSFTALVPSVHARAMEIDPSISAASLILNPEPLVQTDDEGNKIIVADEDRIYAITRDLYVTLMHVAVAKTNSVSVTEFTQFGSTENCALMFKEQTAVAEPVGPSAIVHGLMTSAEPIETLIYQEDFAATESFSTSRKRLSDFEHAVHLWDWRRASRDIGGIYGYASTIRNNRYQASVSEHDMLGVSATMKTTRFITPLAAKAVTKAYVDWLIEDDNFIRAQMKLLPQDSLLRDALHARQLQLATQLYQVLMSMGATGAGKRATELIVRKIGNQMFRQNRADHYSDLQVGTQRRALNVWAGMVVMEQLGLITTTDRTYFQDLINRTRVLSYIVGSQY